MGVEGILMGVGLNGDEVRLTGVVAALDAAAIEAAARGWKRGVGVWAPEEDPG
jgi:hypothetical protein